MESWRSFERRVGIAALTGGLLGIVLIACDPRDGADSTLTEAGGLNAELYTNQGMILVRLEPERAPLATANFVGLAEGTLDNDAFEPGRPYYDGSRFHRVVPGHVIQAGAPESDEADSPGYTFPNEIHAGLSHDRAGVLGVANSGPHTNSGQFYITLDDRSYLDGMYIVFGEVLEGMDVVRSIGEGDVVDSVRVVRSGRMRDFRPDSESFQTMVDLAEARVLEHEQERSLAEEDWIARNLSGLEGDRHEVRTAPAPEGRSALPGPSVVRPESETAGAASVEAPVQGAQDAVSGAPTAPRARYRGVALRYRGHLIGYEGPVLTEAVFGSGDDGTPGFHESPLSFSLEAGAPDIPRALEAIVARMEPGERWIAVVPAEQGYGSTGFFAPERAGEPRFVIPPETMIVYEVERLDR